MAKTTLKRESFDLCGMTYAGFDTGKKWNGFNVPAFERPTAEQIIKNLNAFYCDDLYEWDQYSMDRDASLFIAGDVSNGNLFIFEGFTFEKVDLQH